MEMRRKPVLWIAVVLVAIAVTEGLVAWRYIQFAAQADGLAREEMRLAARSAEGYRQVVLGIREN
jgi:hypothetical protein